MKEIWKPVVGYEGLYDVSNIGRVRSYYVRGRTHLFTKNPRILSAGNVRGYQQILLCRDGIHASGLVHRLVAEAFLGAPPTTKHQVNHRNFDKADNRPENLEWVTQTENNRYSSKVIPRLRGESNRSKLTEEDVRYIRRRYQTGQITLKYLASMFGVSSQTIYAITQHLKWKHVV